MKVLIMTGLLILVPGATAIAQSTLPKKPYTEWSLNEVTRLLYDSQWTKSNDHLGPPDRYRPDSPDFPPATNFFVHIQLYSALPVRQAIVRRMQLTIRYSELTVAQRASFDAEVDGLLKCPACAQYYIVTLTWLCLKSQILKESNCRGDPPWPPVSTKDACFQARAATEGRPYS